jgi:large subunit ribosomal protein L1
MGRRQKSVERISIAARKLVEARPYKLEEAAELLRKAHYVKFDETVELVLNLGVDSKQSDQMVRGTVVLPHGLGKSKRVLVIASGEKFARRKKRARILSAAKTWSRRFRKAGRITKR